MKSNWLPTALCLLVSIVANSSSQANLVTNGDFETGAFSGWTVTPAVSGSILSVTPFAGVGGSRAAGFGATASEYDSISQVLATTAGQPYTLSFFLSNSIDGSDSFQALWDGGLVFSETPVASPATLPNYTQFTYNVVASGAMTTLEFRGYDSPSAVYLDDVSVTTAVPEARALVVWSALGLAAAMAVFIKRTLTQASRSGSA